MNRKGLSRLHPGLFVPLDLYSALGLTPSQLPEFHPACNSSLEICSSTTFEVMFNPGTPQVCYHADDVLLVLRRWCLVLLHTDRMVTSKALGIKIISVVTAVTTAGAFLAPGIGRPGAASLNAPVAASLSSATISQGTSWPMMAPPSSISRTARLGSLMVCMCIHSSVRVPRCVCGTSSSQQHRIPPS